MKTPQGTSNAGPPMIQAASRILLIPTLAAIGLVLAAGCGEYDPSDPAAGVAIHVDPPHWPSDLPDAVDRLERGQQSVRAALLEGQTEEARDDLVPVVRDLARWLPRVAADSEMPEPEWNQVHGIAGRLLPIYETILRDLDRGRAVDLARLSEADPLLDGLREAINTADPSWFAPLPSGNRDVTDDQDQEYEDGPIDLEEAPADPPEDDSNTF